MNLKEYVQSCCYRWREKPIEGIDVYECLKDVPHNIDVVAIIDKQSKMDVILEEVELLDIQNMWFEKGSFSEMMIKRLKI